MDHKVDEKEPQCHGCGIAEIKTPHKNQNEHISTSYSRYLPINLDVYVPRTTDNIINYKVYVKWVICVKQTFKL